MSFICQSCNIAQPVGTEMNKVVTEIRTVQYPSVKDREGNIRIPAGFETVKEISVCPECKNKQFNILIKEEKIIESKNY